MFVFFLFAEMQQILHLFTRNLTKLAHEKSTVLDRSVLKPHVHVVILEVLRLVARAEIEEMTSVMDVLLEDFVEDIIPIAIDVATELASSLETALKKQ